MPRNNSSVIKSSLRYRRIGASAQSKSSAFPVIFIDRDGVINVDPIGDYIKSWKDFRFETGALEALKKITAYGYEIIIISNQAGIGDNVYPEDQLWDIHKNMLKVFAKEGIRVSAGIYCLHGKDEGCNCRKPQIGLFKEAAKHILFNTSNTFFIGDKVSDVLAGKRFGLKTIMVLTGHGKYEEKLAVGSMKPTHKAKNLLDAVKFLKR